MWHLMDPDPGNWKVDIRGASGVVSAWSYAVNGLGVAMSDMGTIPLNEPTAIVAYATDQQGLTVLDSVSIVARITSPGGKVFAYDLNDDGVTGDAVASDGYYSTTISPLTEQGEAPGGAGADVAGRLIQVDQPCLPHHRGVPHNPGQLAAGRAGRTGGQDPGCNDRVLRRRTDVCPSVGRAAPGHSLQRRAAWKG